MKSRLIVILTTITIIAALISPLNAEEPVKQQLLVDQARIIFKSFMTDKNMAWFREHMHKAKGFSINSKNFGSVGRQGFLNKDATIRSD